MLKKETGRRVMKFEEVLRRLDKKHCRVILANKERGRRYSLRSEK